MATVRRRPARSVVSRMGRRRRQVDAETAAGEQVHARRRPCSIIRQRRWMRSSRNMGRAEAHEPRDQVRIHGRPSPARSRSPQIAHRTWTALTAARAAVSARRMRGPEPAGNEARARGLRHFRVLPASGRSTSINTRWGRGKAEGGAGTASLQEQELQAPRTAGPAARAT